MAFNFDEKSKYKNFLIVILLIGVVAMTIIYANFTRYLLIDAYASVSGKNWDIHFENLSRQSITSENTIRIIKEPYILPSSTEIRNLEVEFNKPGDFVIYDFDIVNAGSIEAKLEDYTIGIPKCDIEPDLCNYVKFIIRNRDGSSIVRNAVLKPGERKNMTMIIKFEETAPHLPNQKMNITNLVGIFYYIQN